MTLNTNQIQTSSSALQNPVVYSKFSAESVTVMQRVSAKDSLKNPQLFNKFAEEAIGAMQYVFIHDNGMHKFDPAEVAGTAASITALQELKVAFKQWAAAQDQNTSAVLNRNIEIANITLSNLGCDNCKNSLYSLVSLMNAMMNLATGKTTEAPDLTKLQIDTSIATEWYADAHLAILKHFVEALGSSELNSAYNNLMSVAAECNDTNFTTIHSKFETAANKFNKAVKGATSKFDQYVVSSMQVICRSFNFAHANFYGVC